MGQRAELRCGSFDAGRNQGMKIRSILAALVCLLGASNAHAVVSFIVTTQVTGDRPLNAVLVGDEVTLNVRMTNPTLRFIGGVGGAVQGYDSSIVQFVSGVSADTSLFCTNGPCSNGLISAFDTSTPLEETNSVLSFGPYVQFVAAISVNLRNGAGTADPGIDGIVNGADAEFRIVFQVINVDDGPTSFDIGTTLNPIVGNVIVWSTLASGGVVTPDAQGNNATITVPEPSAVATGLGAIACAGVAVGVRRRMAI